MQRGKRGSIPEPLAGINPEAHAAPRHTNASNEFVPPEGHIDAGTRIKIAAGGQYNAGGRIYEQKCGPIGKKLPTINSGALLVMNFEWGMISWWQRRSWRVSITGIR